MMRVVGYTRVSTEEQASSGCSLAAQADKIRSYCGLYGLNLIAILEDAGQSAKTLGRPGLRQALLLLDAGTADGIVIAKLCQGPPIFTPWGREKPTPSVH